MAEADPSIEAVISERPLLTPAFAVRLEAALKVKAFISKQETRYYLNGVFIDHCPAGGALCVATDGHRLGVRRDADGLVLRPTIAKLPAEIKMPKPLRRGLPAKAWLVGMSNGSGGHLSIVLPGRDDTPEDAIARVEDCVLRVGHVMIDGTFPDWKKVIPSKADGFERSFQSRLLADFGGNISINASDPAAPHIVQTDDPDFVGVLMPVRMIERPLPDWLPRAEQAA